MARYHIKNILSNLPTPTPTPIPASTPTPTPIDSVITYPATDNESYNKGNMTVTWSAVSGASYEVNMRDTTVNMLILDSVNNGTSNSYTILSNYFYEGHSYRIAVKTTVGSSVAWAARNFNINLSSARNTIISRGIAMINYSWTPTQDVRGWKDLYTFYQGIQYQGIPYSQTEYQCSISSVNWTYGYYFDSKMNDSSSGFYDDYTRFDPPIIMPKYGNDCSGYVSVNWNITRHTTAGIINFPRVGKTVETYLKQFARMSPGDAFVRSVNGHTFIIKEIIAINDANGNLSKLEFICNEQTPYWCRTRTWYSDDCENGGYIGVCKDASLTQDYSWDWQ